MIGLQRNSPHQANNVKQLYQKMVRDAVKAQLPYWFTTPIDFPVMLILDVRYGDIRNLAGKKGSKTNGGRCDADNSISIKMLQDALTIDPRKRFQGTLKGCTLRTKNKVKPDEVPEFLYNTDGDPVPVLLSSPVNPTYGARGGILKKPYQLDLTIKADKLCDDRKLWYPYPDQSHAVLTDDKRSIVPCAPVVLHSELKSDKPGMDVHIFAMGDIDHKKWRESVLSFVNDV